MVAHDGGSRALDTCETQRAAAGGAYVRCLDASMTPSAAFNCSFNAFQTQLNNMHAMFFEREVDTR
jgi:hypothetical protein